MNIIAIDPSLSCTALVVNDRKFVYAADTVAMTKKGAMKGWFTTCEPHLTVRVHSNPSHDDHPTLEVLKLANYQSIAHTIIEDVRLNLRPDEEIVVAIEGYSHGSDVGPLIDLVTLGTLIRNGLTTLAIALGVNINLTIMPPTSVKLGAAKLAYPPIKANKAGTKLEYRNKDGMAGGSFKKPEMYQSLLDNPTLTNDPWVKFLESEWGGISLLKGIPKPIEDINDAKIMYEILKARQ